MKSEKRGLAMAKLTPVAAVTAAILGMAACGGANESECPKTPTTSAQPTPVAATSTSSTPVGTAAPSAPPAKSPPLDEAAIATATGAKPESSDGVVKVAFPRSDVEVTVDGSKLPPFMGLTSWAAFTPGKAGTEAMVMGDLVLFEDEVNPAMSALLDGGVDVTALHNHFFYAKPSVYFMHINGEGTVAGLGKAVRAALDRVAEIRKNTPKPLETSGAKPLPAKSSIDAAKLDGVFGQKGASKDGMYKATMGRAATAACGCAIGKTMGVNTWAAFAGSDDDAAVDGDFAVTEAELQPVLKALRGGGINVVAIHSHMTGETPRILFLHYWGRGKAQELAGVVKRAVDLTAWDGKNKST